MIRYDPTIRPGVTIFDGSNCDSSSTILWAAEDPYDYDPMFYNSDMFSKINFLPGLVSSMRIPQGIVVKAYEKTSYEGAYKEYVGGYWENEDEEMLCVPVFKDDMDVTGLTFWSYKIYRPDTTSRATAKWEHPLSGQEINYSITVGYQSSSETFD